MKKILAVLLTLVMACSFTVLFAGAAEGDVAAIGEKTYATLKEAVSAAAKGDTITLLDDVSESVSISKVITLDGAGKKYTGQITISTSFTANNVNFVDGTIYKKNGTNNDVTVKNCTFNGSYADGYAINLRGTRYIVIENCKAKDVDYGLLYTPKTNNTISLKNVEIDGASYGLRISYNNSTSLENVIMKNVSYGVYSQTYGVRSFTFENCVIAAKEAANAFYAQDKGANLQTLYFKGEKNDLGVDVTSYSSELVKVVRDVAKVGDKTYSSLKAAVAAANDGDTVTVLLDHEIASSEAFLSSVYTSYYVFAEVTDKKVTIDLNGKVVTINPDLDKMMLAVLFAVDKGEIVLKDSSEAQTGAINVNTAEATKVYSMFTADEGGKFTIESGSYYINKVDISSKSPRAMLYAGYDKEFFVTGGNFVLGNALTETTKFGGEDIPHPWIANVGGDGYGGIEITGGTFNVDPTHHHGEAVFPGCLTPVEKDGVWVIEIVHTPGDAATCQAAQTCTVCFTELDAIKACTFEVYVSDNNATCSADGTKTAQCIYSCGATDTVTDEGSIKPHTPGEAATCKAPQTCTVCFTELDGIKEHQLGDYVSNNDASCTSDGTKTAECIYGCGLQDTVTDEGSRGSHGDADGNGRCDGCEKKSCEICDGFHDDFLDDVFCLVVEFIRLFVSFVSSVF